MERMTVNELERLLEPLFVCPECNGERYQNYAVYPEISYDFNRADEPAELQDIQSVRTQCRTCGGTGKD
jgi:hypothetical protein